MWGTARVSASSIFIDPASEVFKSRVKLAVGGEPCLTAAWRSKP